MESPRMVRYRTITTNGKRFRLAWSGEPRRKWFFEAPTGQLGFFRGSLHGIQGVSGEIAARLQHGSGVTPLARFGEMPPRRRRSSGRGMRGRQAHREASGA